MRGKSIYPHPAGEEPEGPAEVLEEILLSLNHTVPVAHSGSMRAKVESPPASMINLVALPARAAGLHGGDVRGLAHRQPQLCRDSIRLLSRRDIGGVHTANAELFVARLLRIPRADSPSIGDMGTSIKPLRTPGTNASAMLS